MNSYIEFLIKFSAEIYKQIFTEIQNNRTANVKHLYGILNDINKQLYEMGIR